MSSVLSLAFGSSLLSNAECSSRSETGAGGYFKLDRENVHLDCVKRIKVSQGFRVKLFLMSSKSIFEVEIVECSDRTKSPVRAFYRNLDTYESKENEIEVRIDANSPPLDIQWWRVCGGSLDENFGQLFGPVHAFGYPENQTCIWNITVLNGYILQLNLTVEGYDDSNNCSFDYIQSDDVAASSTTSANFYQIDVHMSLHVKDSYNKISEQFDRAVSLISPISVKLLGYATEENVPTKGRVMESENEEMISGGPICSGMLNWKSNKSMRIVFQSDFDSSTGLSFNASWMSKCGDTFYTDNGELASPDNPENFHFQVRCNWTISVSPGHTIVINYTFPKTANDETGCKSYVQVTEADSDASKILCQSRKFAVHKSSSNILRISFIYEPGMSYTRFYAQWHSEVAQKPKEKDSNTEVGKAESSNWSTKDKDSSGYTTYPIVTLQEKDNKVTKTPEADVILQTVAAPLAIVLIIIIVLSLVWCAKWLRCFSKGNNTYETKENMYDSLNEVDIKAENWKQHTPQKSFNPETFRRRLPTLPTNRLSAILGRVRKGIQFRNERYDTVRDEPKEGFHLTVLGDLTEFHESKQEDELSKQEMLSIRNESTMENFTNIGYISSDNVDQAKTISFCSIKIVKTDCIINENTIATTDNEDYLAPVDDNMTPVDDYLTPVDDNLTPVDDYIIPVDDNITPINDNLTSVDDYLSPVDDNMTPVNDNLTSVDDTLTPIDDYLTPIDHNITPVNDNLTSVDDYLTPVDHNLSSVDDILTPIDDYLTPVDDNLTPKDDYLTPVNFKSSYTEKSTSITNPE
ncbi:hypothetical protein CHS0354_015454 [Potamilus streckersoni]|uniref:CUB domain-containing protein n=1 Tax=Potamilus streckersoni TaxID=2493646 RepID=A0AAE0VHK8_9BIVA|nr:hypothetical protein CHS0354_015454 [Potamilus streckersoni]